MNHDDRHVFRFFVDELVQPGARIELDAFDARHARVLHRAHTDEPVEVVDAEGVVWHATFDGPAAVVQVDRRVAELHEPVIVLYALVRVGGKVDELVDGAVQAGATRIVPVVASARDRGRIDARRDRLTRISATAAKQAKRAAIPIVGSAIELDELRAVDPGVILHPDAPARLDEVLGRDDQGAQARLLVGGADGFPAGLVDELASRGWQQARLGSTVLRSELAAAVAVAIAAMLAPRP